MKFVQKHFTRHHLFHKPHAWFLALLISPIHAAEMHYKKRYHLSFRHAKKLFVFDMILLLSTGIIAALTLFWLLYNPTVTDLVSMTLEPSQDRIRSGDHVTYTISYHNQNDITLNDPILYVELPQGFILDTPVADNFIEEQRAFDLDDLPPQTQRTVSFTGYFFDQPDTDIDIFLKLSYIQEGKKRREMKTHRTINILRESTLVTTLHTSSDTLLGFGTTPLEIQLFNDGTIPLEGITLPLQTNSNQYSIQPTDTTLNDGHVFIDSLAPNTSTTISSLLHTNLPHGINTFNLSLTPTVTVNEQAIAQEPGVYAFTVIHPEIYPTFTWEKNAIAPNTETNLTISLQNTGDVALSNIVINIPLPTDKVALTTFRTKNTALVSNNTAILSGKTHAGLVTLAPGEQRDIVLTVPINYAPAGIQPTLVLNPTMSAQTTGQSSTYNLTTETEPLQIGTQVITHGILRYYTAEGDQLGRGPLPPRVGEETKYWATFEFQNTSNAIGDLVFKATLPPYVTWTGRTSVSHGNDLVYHAATRQITWTHTRLEARSTAGIYMELGLTPTAAQQATSPIIIQNISLQAKDLLLGETLTRSMPALNITLPQDKKGQYKGVTVE
ncbi:hypothetical protein KKG22_00385 [Patescibacteria group bacterium]|nr:hypothetical protein [Patescibacteria group bacterium]MBU1722133.1 hypothetical protein [Patescibacteria group bacterium]MBU1901182.1 hypothetical protein [Patescibacteria group bacterium]